MTLIFDAGALVALERGDRAMWLRLKAALRAGEPPRTHGGIVGQTWRGKGTKQALLARALPGLEIRPLDEMAGRAAGALLAKTGDTDVIDAAVVLLANDDDQIFTSDLGDLEPLATASGRHVELVRT